MFGCMYISKLGISFLTLSERSVKFRVLIIHKRTKNVFFSLKRRATHHVKAFLRAGKGHYSMDRIIHIVMDINGIPMAVASNLCQNESSIIFPSGIIPLSLRKALITPNDLSEATEQ